MPKKLPQYPTPEDVNFLKAEAIKALLVRLITELDVLDEEDFFGTEGWRHRFA